MSLRMRRAGSTKATPALVGLTRRPVRATNDTPISASSARILCPTAAGVMPNCRAASAIEPCSTTQTKVSRNCVSIMNISYLLKE
ncbi:hypothetical protein D9M68_998400 [compost metagenome]